MKCSIGLLIATISISTATFAAELPPVDFVKLGIENSSRLKAAKALIDEARGNKNLARTAFNPLISYSANGSALDRSIDSRIAGLTVVAANQWQGKMAIVAGMAIDISGELRDQVRFADIGVQAAVIRTLIVKNELTRDIRVACLRELQARQLLETAAVASKNAIQRRDAVKLQFDEGVLTKFDVLRSETEVADAAQKVIIAEDRLRVAHANISRLIEVPESSVPYITTATLITDVPDSAIVVPLAMAQRPELGLARLQIRAEELGVRLAGNSERPALSVGLQSYVLSNPSTFEPGRPVNAASVQLRIPIIDRGESKARTQTSEARLEASKWTLKSIEESIRFQVSEAMSNLREAKERVEVATRALKQAEEQYSIGQQRFEGGLTHGALSPMLELSDSQTVLTQAKNNLTNARIDVLIAQAEIDYVMGGTK